VRVVDGEGRAVGNAMVRIVRKDLLGGAEVGGVTDSQGRYRASVSEGRWVVDVGGGRRVVPVEVSGAETQLVTIVQ
jgi:hypothetical protein